MDGYNSPYGIMDNYGQPGYADDPADESRQSLYGAAMPTIEPNDTVGRPVHDRAPSQSGFGGYTPAKDAETLGGSEGNYSSKGGDPFSTPGGSGSGIYASAMPQTDAAQKYLDEELQWRRQHQPSMLRRVLGTAASLYNPAIGQLISDPGGHDAKFRQNLPLYQAKSKLEQDELTKQATIAQKEEAEANSRAIRDQSQQSALDRQDTGTEIQPVQQMPSSATLQGPPPLTSPVAPDLMGPPAPEPQGPPVEPQGPPSIPPPSPLAGMYNPTVQTPGGSVPFDPKLSTPVVGGRPAPAGFERRRQTTYGKAAETEEAKKSTEDAIPDELADAFKMPRGTRMNDSTQARLWNILRERDGEKNPTTASIAMKAAAGDEASIKALKLISQTTQEGKIQVVNQGAADKTNAARAIRSAFQSAGGDWQKVIDNERNNPSEFSSDVVDHAQKMLALPPTVQKQVTAADTTGDMAKKASDAIDAFTKAHPDLVGGVAEHPINAGKRKMETWAGTEPADIGDVDTALASVAALQPGQHNFRSIQALEEFKRNLGIDPRTGKPDGSRAWLINPEKAKQGLKAVAEFNQNLKENALKTAGRGGGSNSGGAGGAPQKDQTRNYNGAIYKFDGTQWVKQ